MLDVFNGGLLTGILLGINKFANSLGKTSSNLNKMVKNASGFLDKLGKSLSGSLEKITGLLDGVRGCLEAWQSNIKAGTLLKIASAVGILAVSLAVLSTIDQVRMTSALSGITVLFAELIGAMKLFTKIADKGDLKNLNKIAVSMIGLSAALLILSFAVKNLAGLDWNQLAVGLTGITVLLGELVGVSAIMSKNKIGMTEGSVGLILLSTALVVLSAAVKNLSSLDWNQLAVGLTGITILLGELVGASAIISKCNIGLVKGSTGLILLSSALSVLCLAVKSLAVLDWNQLAIGLTGITVLLGELVAVSEIMSGQSASMIASAIGILEIAAALSVLAKIVTAFSTLEPEKLEQGLIGTGALLTGIIIAFETILGLAALVLSPLTPVLVALGVAVAAIGIGMLSAGAGVLAFATGLTMLGAAFAVNGAVIITALEEIINLLPLLAAKIGESIVASAVAIGQTS